MGSVSKHSMIISSDKNSSEEINEEDHQNGVGRFYECNFCKRGFTNAQALGGHMNIHRKDKVNKSKLKLTPNSSKSSNPSRYFEHFSTSDYRHQQYFAVPHVDYQFYVPTLLNPNLPLEYHHHHCHHSDSASPRSTEQDVLEEDHRTANLSMQIDDHQQDSDERNKEVLKENELDLELRLG